MPFRFDTIWENARIQTFDPAHPWAHAVAVSNGRIAALDDGIEGLGARERIDLGGRYLCPGLNDAHCHLSVLGRNLNEINLSAASVGDLEGLYDAIARACRSAEPGRWVIGWGFNQLDLGGYPTLAKLDEICAGHPVYLEHLSHHAAVVNSRAFALAGFPDPDAMEGYGPDQLVRDAGGHVTGLVCEHAARVFKRLVSDRDESELVEDLRVASDYALSMGLSSYAEAGVTRIDVFQKAVECGAMRLRGTLMPLYSKLHDVDGLGPGPASFGLDLGMRTGFGDDMLSIGACKIVLDGAFSSRTASLSEPYEGVGGHGVLQWDRDEVVDGFAHLHRAGWQVAAHAIGDNAVRLALDAIERAQRLFPRRDARHRIEHCGLMSDDMIARLVADHIVPVPQGSFIPDYGDGYVKVIGMRRAMMADRAGSYVRLGAVIPGSTDAPSARLSPLWAIQGAVTRRTRSGLVLGGPGERLSLDEALRAYTFGSAYASHHEREVGTIQPGKLADFTILEKDPHVVPVGEIANIAVDAVVIGGETQFER